MRRRRGPALPVILVTGLAALVPGAIAGEPAAAGAGPTTDGPPELAIAQPHWQRFDTQGRPVRELRAERLEKQATASSARLFEPHLALTDARGRVWRARARTGWLHADGRRLRLEGGVELHREPRAGGLVVTTDALQIGGPHDPITTDQPVVITTGNWHFTATGLRAEPDDRRLELLGNVRGIHD